MKIIRKALEQLLLATRREQNINGKSQTQVDSCVLRLEDNVLSTTNIVKDGKTSLSRFSFTTDEQEDSLIPVADIERMLGVLKYHGDYVTLSVVGDEKNKVRVKSNKKQTTLVGGMKAKAYSNSQHILEEYEKQALSRAKQIKGNVYVLSDDDSTITPFFKVSLTASDLHDALRCDGMNGQKLNRYKFECDGDTLSVSVGDLFKGMTTSVLAENYAGKAFTATFEGGLENILKHYAGNVRLSFLDFSDFAQGTRLIMQFDNDDWVLQAGLLE